MLRKTLNLGILAHVDAGKTTLTERLLYAAGVIDAVGRVDHGTTQTDSLELERQRGITIKSAVASFAIGDVTVNLIDTPGHPDFIAEVERVLGVLDGAVLVISAVEGVQPQTVLLMRALQRLRVPTLMFVNKIDRAGAGYDRVLDAIRARLAPNLAPMGSVHALGTRGARFTTSDDGIADAVAANDDALLAAYVDGTLSDGRLRAAVAAQTAASLVHPVFFGSALTGAGVDSVMAGIAELLPGDVRRRRRAGLGHGFQGRTGPGRRKDRVRPHVLGDRPDSRPSRRGQGDGDQRLRRGRGHALRVGGGRPDREGLGPRRRPDRRRDRRQAGERRPPLRTADARDRRRPVPRRGQRPPPGRARPAG